MCGCGRGNRQKTETDRKTDESQYPLALPSVKFCKQDSSTCQQTTVTSKEWPHTSFRQLGKWQTDQLRDNTGRSTLPDLVKQTLLSLTHHTMPRDQPHQPPSTEKQDPFPPAGIFFFFFILQVSEPNPVPDPSFYLSSSTTSCQHHNTSTCPFN